MSMVWAVIAVLLLLGSGYLAATGSIWMALFLFAGFVASVYNAIVEEER